MSAAGPHETRPRAFGLGTATFVVISSMIGTGVLTTSGFTVYYVGSNQLMLIMWVVGGVAALCGALALSELAAMFPRTGGDYVFLYEAYGPLPAFLSGWVSFLIGFGGPIAANSYAAANYLLEPLDLPDSPWELPEKLLATAAIVAFAVVHGLSRRSTVRVQGSLTALKLGLLGLLALAGIVAGWQRTANLADPVPMDGPRLRAAIFSLVFISYAYTGWNAAAYIAGTVDQPRRNIPRAMLLGTGLVMALYLALNVFYALALSAADVRALVPTEGGEPNLGPLARIAEIAAQRLFSPRIAGALSVAIGMTLLASLSAYVLTGPHVAQAMATAGQFPAVAARLSRRGTPVAATILQVAWALVLLWSGSFEKIIIYASVGLALFSILSVAGIFVLRRRSPGLDRPFRTPGYPLVPLFYLVTTGLLAGAAFLDAPEPSALALASILAGVPVYYLWFRGRPPAVPDGPT